MSYFLRMTRVHGSTQHNAIKCVVNYWEIPLSQMDERVRSWANAHVRECAVFVPWHHVETDITHSLNRFLVACAKARQKVNVIVTPELGVSYLNSGIPKEIVQNREYLARDSEKKLIPVVQSPNIFPLPSMYHQAVQKRIFSAQSRIDSIIRDAIKMEPDLIHFIRVTIGSSFYGMSDKSQGQCPDADQNFTASLSIDQSEMAISTRRSLIEAELRKPEFAIAGDPTKAPGFWNSKSLEPMNHDIASREHESRFRSKVHQTFKRKEFTGGSSLPIDHAEMVTIESNQSFSKAMLGHFTSKIDSSSPDVISVLVEKLFKSIAHESKLAGHYFDPSIGVVRVPKWISIQDSGIVSDAIHKGQSLPAIQSLLINAILWTATAEDCEGGVLLPLETWLKLSESFRNRLEHLIQGLDREGMKKSDEVIYFSSKRSSRDAPVLLHTVSSPIKKGRDPKAGSGVSGNVAHKKCEETSKNAITKNAGTICSELDQLTGLQWIRASADESLLRVCDAIWPRSKLLILDPQIVMTIDRVRSVYRLAESGRVVVVPRHALYTIDARNEWTRLLASKKSIPIQVGLHCQIFSFTAGNLIFYDCPERPPNEMELRSFVSGVLSVVEFDRGPKCNTGGTDLTVLRLRSSVSNSVLFLSNNRPEAVSSEIEFQLNHLITEYSVSSTSIDNDLMPSRVQAFESPDQQASTLFSMDLPGFSVVPVRARLTKQSQNQTMPIQEKKGLSNENSGDRAGVILDQGRDSWN